MWGHQAISQGLRGRRGLRPLDIEEEDIRPRSQSIFSSRRYSRCTLSVLLVLGALVLLAKLYSPDAIERMRYEGMTLYAPTERPQPPSLFVKYTESEKYLSRQSVQWWKDQAREERFLSIPARRQGSSWGPYMQELILNTYAASRSDRILVLDNYRLHEEAQGWIDYAHHEHEPYPMPIVQLPVSSIVRVFAPADGHSQMTWTITRDVWHDLCPDAHPRLAGENTQAQASLRPLDSAEALAVLDDRCVELSEAPLSVDSSGDALLNIWPDLSTSTVLSHFAWSPLIELAFDMNRELISPVAELEPYLSTQPFTNSADRYRHIPGLLALHIPRGIHQDYCRSLVTDSQKFGGFNALPFLPDTFNTSALAGMHDAERTLLYHRRCMPIIQEIVRRVDHIRKSPIGRDLRSVYVATNGQSPWLLELKTALRRMGGWTSVSSTRDLVLNREQRYVKDAVDMLVAQRAQVFVGNGFSTESGQVVMLRTANGFPVNSTRHW